MAVELAEVAAGLPMAASLALAGGITSVREGRRRAALNEAMHELRRPLQALSLALPGDLDGQGAADSSLRLAVAALERLDQEINGGESLDELSPLSMRPLLEEAVNRWEPQAVRSGGCVQLQWSGEEVWVKGSRSMLSQAVDNLISNGLEHGRGRVTIEACREGSRCVLLIRSNGRKNHRQPPRRLRPGGRARHGYGLRVVARVARSHGGQFDLRLFKMGAEAQLLLPVCSVEKSR